MDMSKNETKQKRTPMDAFNVKTLSEEGVKMHLELPDGTETDEFLVVRGADCKTFKRAIARTHRQRLKRMKAQNGKDIDPAVEAAKTEKEDRELVAILVVGWSFEKECTQENVLKFLESAPQVEEQINEIAGKREHFFKKPLTD